MTLKHIGFYDSPVMRELARQAIENGTVSSQDVSSIIKKAKNKDIYAPSGNVFDDMVRLADGLRSKGYVNEAKVLEEKILNYKVAAHEFSKILDEAHPEGDVEVAKAKDDNGVVETIVGVHDLFMEQINKKPSAKSKMAASEFSPILDAAHPDGDVEVAKAKDDNGVVETIVSVHDLIMQKMNKKPSAKQAFVSSILKIAEGILKGGQNAADPKDHIYKIDKLNSIAEEVNSSVQFAKDTIASIPTNVTLFTKNNVLSLIPLFTKYAKLDSATVSQTLNLYVQVYRGQEASAKTVYNNLAQQSPAEQKQYTSLVNVAIYDNLLNPDRESKLSLFNGPMQLGKELGKAYRGYSNEELQQAAQAMHNAVSPMYEVTFGDANLAAANAAVSKKIEESKATLLAELANAPTLPKLEYTATSNAPIIDGLNMIFNAFKQLSQKPEVNTLIAEISSVDQSMLAAWNLAEITSSLSAKISMAASLELSKADAVVSKATAEGIASSFAKTFNLVMGLIKNDEENKGYLSFRDTLGGIYSGLKSVIDSFPVITLSKLLNAVKKQLPSVNSLESLQQTANEWFEKTQMLISEGSINIELKKEGQAAGFPLSGTPKPSGVKPPAGTPAVKSKGTLPGPLDPKEKEAVAKMQILLVELGNKHKDPSLTAVGKNGSQTPDGAWGGGTGSILAKVNEKFKSKLETGPNANSGWGGRGQETIDKANVNTRVLETLLGKQPSSGETQDTIFGAVVSLNNAVISNKDLQSLHGIYDFAIRAGAKEQSVVDETAQKTITGIPLQHFVYVLNEVYKQAVMTYKAHYGDKTAADFYLLAKSRLVEYQQQFANLDAGKPGVLMTRGMLGSYSKSQKSTQQVANHTFLKKLKDHTLNDGTVLQVESWLINGKPTKIYISANGARYYEQDNGEFVQLNAGSKSIDEGSDVSMEQTFVSPFTKAENINLQANRRYFPQVRSMIGPKHSYLYLDHFDSSNAKTLAQHLFSNKNVDAEELFVNFLNQLRKDITSALNLYLSKGASETEGARANDVAAQWQERISLLLNQLPGR